MTVTVEPGGRVLKPYPLHRVALVGMGPSAVAFANSVYYEEFRRKLGHSEAWTLNYGHQVWQHDLLFNMHDLVHMRQHAPEADYIEGYKDHPQRVVTTRFVGDIANCYEFPFEELFKRFGDTYFSCGSAYMVAFAIMCLELQEGGAKELHIFGMDFNYHGREEYEAGRCCLEYWIGRAVGMGIDVKVPSSSALMDLYQRSHLNGLQGNGKMYGMQGLEPVFTTSGGKLQLTGWKSNEPD